MGWIHADDSIFSMSGSYNSDSDACKTYVYVSPEDKAKIKAWEKRIEHQAKKAVAWFNSMYGGSWERVTERNPDFFLEYDPERGRYIDPKTGQCEGINYDLKGMCLFLFQDSIEIPPRPKIKSELRYIDSDKPVQKQEIEDVSF
ncbi:MAG: hypothetical protein ICV63_14330 [Coleofasciculus sp. Co-bin14]|nr:hypothetical protein [Coleofasciculus sp. Co-bin14]